MNNFVITMFKVIKNKKRFTKFSEPKHNTEGSTSTSHSPVKLQTMTLKNIEGRNIISN